MCTRQGGHSAYWEVMNLDRVIQCEKRREVMNREKEVRLEVAASGDIATTLLRTLLLYFYNTTWLTYYTDTRPRAISIMRLLF